MSVRVRRFCVAALITAIAGLGVAHAGALTPDQTSQLNAYMKVIAKPKPVVPQSDTGPSPVAASSLAAGSDGATVAGQDDTKITDPRVVSSLLTLSAPDSVPPGMGFGIASGEGVQPALPDMQTWDAQAGLAIVAAFKAPDPNTTADQAATFAADATAPVDPAFEERVGLMRTLFHVDGTEDLIRHFVATEHMKLIIGEVARHIDFTKLSETDKYRLAAIAAVAQTELEDKIIDLNARMQAANLSKSEIMQLVVAFDIDAQRKLTQMRLNDDGKIDSNAELDLRIAMYQIVKQFEAGQ